MKNVFFIWRDIGVFKKRYDLKFQMHFDDYCNKIQESTKSITTPMRYSDFDTIKKESLSVDLIIAEDNVDTIMNLTRRAIDCELINTIIICDDLGTLDKIVAVNSLKPKLITLDFMFKGITTVHKNVLNETLQVYKGIKAKWPEIPVLGITNYLHDDKVKPLRDELGRNGDDLYNKAGIFDALSDVLRNRMEYYKLQFIKSRKAGVADLPGLIADLNKALIEKEIVLEAEVKTEKIMKLLDLQEKVLTFIYENAIRYKSVSLAGGILYCEKNPDTELTKMFFANINTTSKEEFRKFNLPDQPLVYVYKYFRAFDENGIITKEARIILQLLNKYPKRWPVSVNKAKLRNPASFSFITFLDNIVTL